MSRHASRRRSAALLLVVLFVLVLLLMLGLSYLTIAMRYRKTAGSNVEGDRRTNAADANKVLNSALYQILRGSRNANSAIGVHSLLEDVYGRDGFEGTVGSVDVLANGQFLQIGYSSSTGEFRNHDYDGCVITVAAQDGTYESGRIVQSLGDENELLVADIYDVEVGDKFRVNGYPFNAIVGESAAEQDESWDAVDEQNFALASLARDSRPGVPSFHRPGSSARPSVTDHPGFATNNPRYDPENGPWDVDNNGDGKVDSIWMDIGFPAVEMTPGVMAKPLVAALVLDLDGRLNVNVHGNWNQLPQSAVRSALESKVRQRKPPAGSDHLPFYPRGQGIGPAGVSLWPLFAEDDGDSFAELLNRRYATPQVQYGRSNQPGIQSATDARLFDAPSLFEGDGSQVYHDAYGQPVWVSLSKPENENPYEMAQQKRRSGDQPFGNTDQEWILRRADPDAGRLSNRLSALIQPDVSKLVTTRSFSMPHLPKRGRRGLIQVLRDRLTEGGVESSAMEAQLEMMLPPEILRGEKMDLNRVFVSDGIAQVPGGFPSSIDSPREQERYAKGVYARHLYCILMTLLEADAKPDTRESLSKEQSTKLLARQMAQWAINVVDYRDADGASTPFEYDENPFDGWHANGVLANHVLSSGQQEPNDGTVNVVWGMERPEVVVTESVAWHDRMVGDLEVGGYRSTVHSGLVDDDDLDQIRRPLGVLLVELQSPHSPEATVESDRSWPLPIDDSGEVKDSESLYFLDSINGVRAPQVPVLNLDKTQVGSGGHRYSVWRVAISKWHGRAGTDIASPLQLLAQAPDSSPLEPDSPVSVFDSNRPGLQTERIICLASEQLAEDHPDYGRGYFTETIPGFWSNRAQLPVGETMVIAPFPNFTVGQGPRQKLPWVFQRTAQKFVFAEGDSEIEYETEEGHVSRRDAYSIMATSGPIRNANGSITPSVGLSVTEPLPKHYAQAYGINRTIQRDVPSDTHPLAPLSEDALLRETHTDENYKTLFLQRLADPGIGWNPLPGEPHYDSSRAVNPYITVDWMPVAVSVFNSAMMPAEIDGWKREYGNYDPDDPVFDDPDFRYEQRLKLGSREWSGKLIKADPITKALQLDDDRSRVSDFWGLSARINPSRLATRNQRPPLRLGNTIGWIPSTEFATSPDVQPAIPRPWIAWNNRDFSNHFELLNVPKSSSSRFRFEFSTWEKDRSDGGKQFGHLLDFFDDERTFYRLFDYVHAPSHFIDTMVAVPADQVQDQDIAGLDANFRHRSRFREPGKINLHTATDPRIWQALGLEPLVPWSNVRASQAQSMQTTGRPIPWSLRDVQTKQPLLAATKRQDAYANPWRNASFFHQAFQRLGNTTTVQSNVYGIWLTIGYFQVHTPDGHRDASLGAELGMDYGIVQRHRGFYLVDRSIPVAFEPGENHNIEEIVLLRRLLE